MVSVSEDQLNKIVSCCVLGLRIGKPVSEGFYYRPLQCFAYFHASQFLYCNCKSINHATLYTPAHSGMNWQPKSGPVLLRSEPERD